MTNLQTYIAPRNERMIRADSAILESLWIDNTRRHIDYHVARWYIRIQIIGLRNLRASPNWKEPKFIDWLRRQEHIRLERIRNIYRNRPAARMMRDRLIARGQSALGNSLVQS